MGAARKIFEDLVPDEEEVAEQLFEKLQELKNYRETPFLISYFFGALFLIFPFAYVLFYVKPSHVTVPPVIDLFVFFAMGMLLGPVSWFLWFRRRCKQRVAALKIILQNPVARRAVEKLLNIGTKRIKEAESQLQRLLGLHQNLCKFRKLISRW